MNKKFIIKVKIICKCALFFTGIFLIIYNLNILVIPKYTEGIERTTTEGVYYESPNSIDVLFLGSSHVYDGISPYEIWMNEGITSYVYAASIQPTWISYYRLKEFCKYQTPKVLVLDIGSVFINPEILNEQLNRWEFDYMRPSINKFYAVKDSLLQEESILSYFFPIVQYHSRWNKLTKEDFDYFKLDKKSLNKGFAMIPYTQSFQLQNSNPNTEIFKYTNENTYEIVENVSDKLYTPNSKSLQYLSMIVEYCKNNNIELVFIKVPSILSWSEEYYNNALEISKNLNIPFFDFTYGDDSYYITDIDWATDSFDGGKHLNLKGATKASMTMGDLLKDLYPELFQTNNEIQQLWNSGLEEYIERKKINLLKMSLKMEDYFDKLNNTDYIILIAGRDDVAWNWNESSDNIFKRLGFQSDLYGKGHASFIGVIDNEKVIFEKCEFEQLAYETKLDNNLKVELLSAGYELGDTSSIKINDIEYALNRRGMNIVVYSKQQQQVIDQSCIDVFDNWKMYHK